MRKLSMLIVLLWILIGTTAVQAQQTMSTFLTGANPRHLTFTPIDTSRAIRPAGNTFRPFRPLQLFNIGNVFRRFEFPISFPPRIGTSQFPTMQVQTSGG